MKGSQFRLCSNRGLLACSDPYLSNTLFSIKLFDRRIKPRKCALCKDFPATVEAIRCDASFLDSVKLLILLCLV